MDKSGQSTDAPSGGTYLPTVEAVADDLKRVIHMGLRASAISQHRTSLQALFGLPVVREAASGGSDAGASSIVRLVRQCLGGIRSEDPDMADGLGRLLGSNDSAATMSPVERRRWAAPILVGWDQPPESFLKRQQSKFCSLLAERLIVGSMEEAGLANEDVLGLDPIVVPKGVQHVTIEQQWSLDIDEDWYARRVEQFNTIRYEVDGPFDVRRILWFTPVFEIYDVQPLVAGTRLTIEEKNDDALHMRFTVPALPRGSIYTFGWVADIKGGTISDGFTVVSGRTMRAFSLRVNFERDPAEVWRLEDILTVFDAPSSRPDTSPALTPEGDGAYIARFQAPVPNRYFGLGWG